MSKSADSFKVVGCGLSRTGTYSISKALEILLGGKCHHGYTVAFEKGREHLDFWTKFSYSEPKDLDGLREFLTSRGYTAGLDIPFMYHYKEVLQAFPNVKVLLTMRDPKSWYKSFQHVIGRFRRNRQNVVLHALERLTGKSELFDTMIDKMGDLFAAVDKGEEAAIEFYHNWTERVKRDVPADQLLIYDIKEGWEPLCKFLDVPIPDCDFPRLNSSSSMEKTVGDLLTKAIWLVLFLLALVVVGLSYFVHGFYLGKFDHGSQVYIAFTVLLGLFLLLLYAWRELDFRIKEFSAA